MKVFLRVAVLMARDGRCIYLGDAVEPHRSRKMLMDPLLRETVLAKTVLITTLDSLTDASQRETALRLVREWYDLGRCVTVDDTVVRGALARILGEPVAPPTFEPTRKPADLSMFETFGKAWLTWASGGDPVPVLKTEKASEFGGAIHMMVLEPWGQAIKALSENDLEEAQRLFRRTIELGTQCGTDTNDVVQWTYAASFFHLGT